jgi:hypothetical protein
MTRMTAMRIRIWIQLPVCGRLELTLRPKKPSNQSMNKITMIVHNIRFLLIDSIGSHPVNRNRPGGK